VLVFLPLLDIFWQHYGKDLSREITCFYFFRSILNTNININTFKKGWLVRNLDAQRCEDGVPSCKFLFFSSQPVDWAAALGSLPLDGAVGEVAWARPGAASGTAMLESFIDLRLRHFATHRNDPNSAALSQLSPWIRFGRWTPPPKDLFELLLIYIDLFFAFRSFCSGF